MLLCLLFITFSLVLLPIWRMLNVTEWSAVKIRKNKTWSYILNKICRKIFSIFWRLILKCTVRFQENVSAVSDLLFSFRVSQCVSVKMLLRQILLQISRCTSGSVELVCELCFLPKCRIDHPLLNRKFPPGITNWSINVQKTLKHKFSLLLQSGRVHFELRLTFTVGTS